MTALYVDVSHHDRERRGTPLDWHKVASAGLGTVMCARVTYGDPAGWHYDTPYACETLLNARSAGYVARGAYHNLVRGDDASIGRQVDWLRRRADTRDATWVMCDVEAYDELRTNGLVPRWADVVRFHDRWHTVDGRVCAWYIPRWVWSQYLGSPDVRHLRGPLVQSHYVASGGTAQQTYTSSGGDGGTGWDDSFGGRLPDIWQFTSQVSVPGLTDRTDVNAYRGTVAQLVATLNGTHSERKRDDVPKFLRLPNGAIWVSSGPLRYTIKTPEDLAEALAGWGLTAADLRSISPERLGAYGVDVEDDDLELTDAQLDMLKAAVVGLTTAQLEEAAFHGAQRAENE